MTALAKTDNEALEKAILHGDLKKLSPEQRIQHYQQVCESLGLNPLTTPFAYIELQGKLRLYALRSCTEQLRSIHKVSVEVAEAKEVGDCYVISATATMPDGRFDTDMGAVPIKGLSGERLANALMKAVTKAKRRVTLGICGLAFLDEAELDTVPAKTHAVGDVHALVPDETKALKASEPKPRVNEDGVVVPRPDGSSPSFPSGEFEGCRLDDFKNVPAAYLERVATAPTDKLRDAFGDATEDLQAWAQWLTAKVAT